MRRKWVEDPHTGELRPSLPRGPKKKSSGWDWLTGGAETDGDERPPMVELTDNATVEARILADAADYLNGWEMGPFLKVKLKKLYDLGDLEKRGRDYVALHVHTIVDQTIELMAEKHENMGDYIAIGSTASMGSVMGSGWGEHRKDGSWRT